MAIRNDKPIKDKEQTKRRLINAVTEVFKSEGYAGLGVNKIARVAGVNKKLIYRYFGSFENLIEAYVVETDYWMQFADHLRQLTVPKDLVQTKRLIGQVLKNQFIYFHADPGMQELILWELTSKSNLMQSIHRTRELMGQQLLEITDEHLSTEAVNFRAVAALLVGGIYYTILHSRHSGGMFSGVDLSKPSGQTQIVEAVDLVLDLVFEKAAK